MISELLDVVAELEARPHTRSAVVIGEVIASRTLFRAIDAPDHLRKGERVLSPAEVPKAIAALLGPNWIRDGRVLMHPNGSELHVLSPYTETQTLPAFNSVRVFCKAPRRLRDLLSVHA